MIRKLIALTFLLALPLMSGFAQQKTDFSGTWKLNVAKSDFGVLPAPESRTEVITHKDPSLSDTVTQESAEGKQHYTANYTTDGKEVVNTIGPREVKATFKWVGSSLAMTVKFQYEGADVLGDNTWALSADGKTLTMTIHYTSSIGDADQKLVFDKQDTGAAAEPAKTP